MRTRLPSGRSRILWLLSAICLAAISLTARPALAADNTALERAIKATYLYKLAPFVTWPDEVFSSPTGPFYICIAGEDPFGSMLDNAVKGQSIGGHAVTIRRVTMPLQDGDCHILYIGAEETQTVAQGLASVRGMPVFTVTDSMSDGDAKGMVNFIVADNRVRFEIDLEAAAQSGLQLSSKLNVLAVPKGVKP